MSDVREVVDGVVYVERECVGCGSLMSVSEDALRVMRGLRWPRCNFCVWVAAEERADG